MCFECNLAFESNLVFHVKFVRRNTRIVIKSRKTIANDTLVISPAQNTILGFCLFCFVLLVFLFVFFPKSSPKHMIKDETPVYNFFSK